MIGHSDWTPGRKIDPGPYFSWEEFANASEKYADLGITKNFGIYPKKSELGFKNNPEIVLSYKTAKDKHIIKEQIEEIQNKLREYGYDIPGNELGAFGKKTEYACLSFNIHFFGKEIVKDKSETCKNFYETQEQYYKKDNVTNWDELHELSALDENSIKALDDILNQF